MPATFATRKWELHHTRPAVTADDAVLGVRYQPLARDAADRKKKVRQRTAARDGERAGAIGQARPAASFTAFHIASRSGSILNQISKDAAPCSTSIGNPSLATLPLSRAARTHAVSAGR